jgi:oligosaccharyltransferase complex subunit alpha (ribophorin I)
MGGWNYTFTLGWDAPLADSARWDAKEERYIVGVPFWTPIPGAVVDDAETSIILPEGATYVAQSLMHMRKRILWHMVFRDVLINFPFPPLAVTRGMHITYLDTIGRPQVVLHAKQVTERHTGMIYVRLHPEFSALQLNCLQVSYKLPTSAHFRKPLAIALGTFGLFVLNALGRRVNTEIHK